MKFMGKDFGLHGWQADEKMIFAYTVSDVRKPRFAHIRKLMETISFMSFVCREEHMNYGGKIMKRDEIVCNCMEVTAGMIRDAIEGGAKTVEDIQEATEAGTVCGGCLDEIQKILDESV